MPKSSVEFTDNKEQEDIVKAYENSVAISNVSLEEVLLAMAEWRLMLGVPKDGSGSEELAIAAKFVHEQYPKLRINELNLACLYYVRQLYDKYYNKYKKIDYYGMLSPLFIGQVLDFYMIYRKDAVESANQRKAKSETQLLLSESSSKPSKKEECELTKKIIADFYKDWQNTGYINDVLSVSYNFFYANKEVFKFVVDKEMIKNAQEWAAKKYLQDRDKDILLDKLQVADLRKKRYARTWCVMDYFSKIKSIEKILNKIVPEMF